MPSRGSMIGVSAPFPTQQVQAAAVLRRGNVGEVTPQCAMTLAGATPSFEKLGVPYRMGEDVVLGSTAYNVAEVAERAEALALSARQSIMDAGLPAEIAKSDLAAVRLAESLASRTPEERISLGQQVAVIRSGGTRFGSGGSWGKWTWTGSKPVIDREVDESTDFVTLTRVTLHWEAPGTLHVAHGDCLGGDADDGIRTFSDRLIVAF